MILSISYIPYAFAHTEPNVGALKALLSVASHNGKHQCLL